VADNYDLAYEKLRETNRAHDELVKKVGKCRKEFEEVKNDRLSAFMTCYNHVSKKIDPVYKVHKKNELQPCSCYSSIKYYCFG
jgi:structural maintenance of chromosome 1